MPFQRLVRDLVSKQGDWRIQSLALSTLQEAAEKYLVTVFEDAQLCATSAYRITIEPRDMILARRIRGH